MSEPKILLPLQWARTNESGISNIIRGPKAEGLIAGVTLEPYTLFPDDRGYFLEIARLGQGLSAPFPLESTQISAALSYSGTIKAFHYHRHQTDFWVPVDGIFQVGLADLREDSPTFDVRNTI